MGRRIIEIVCLSTQNDSWRRIAVIHSTGYISNILLSFVGSLMLYLILISFVFPSVWSAANSDESAGFGVGQLQSKGSVISNTLTRGQVRRGHEG